MRVRRTEAFEHAYKVAPPEVQRAFTKQLRLLLEYGPGYRSLRVHPWPADGPDAMQARITRGTWRFYYYVESDVYVLYHLRPHPKSSKRGR